MALNKMYQIAFEKIMDKFWVAFNRLCAGQSPSSASEYGQVSGSSQEIAKQPPGSRKRVSHNKNSGDEQSDEDEERPRRRAKRPEPNPNPPQRPFACPWRKHNPAKYNVHDHKQCATTPWRNIARLK